MENKTVLVGGGLVALGGGLVFAGWRVMQRNSFRKALLEEIGPDISYILPDEVDAAVLAGVPFMAGSWDLGDLEAATTTLRTVARERKRAEAQGMTRPTFQDHIKATVEAAREGGTKGAADYVLGVLGKSVKPLAGSEWGAADATAGSLLIGAALRPVFLIPAILAAIVSYQKNASIPWALVHSLPIVNIGYLGYTVIYQGGQGTALANPIWEDDEEAIVDWSEFEDVEDVEE